jgi:hypothetical protein
MRAACDRVRDPEIAASYRELAAAWLWLAEMVRRDFNVIDRGEPTRRRGS